MTKDTLKSIEKLKKSLKMNKRAVEKNMAADGTTSIEVSSLVGKIVSLYLELELWEKKGDVTLPSSTLDGDSSSGADGLDPSTN